MCLYDFNNYYIFSDVNLNEIIQNCIAQTYLMQDYGRNSIT